MHIYFSECVDVSQVKVLLPEMHIVPCSMPIIPRIEYYKSVLCDSNSNNKALFTVDEHLLLIAGWMKRNKKIVKLKFNSLCMCEGHLKERVIDVDEDGDLTDNPHHGFFNQRLDFLR